MAMGSGKARVRGQQRRRQELRSGHVWGIVGRQTAPQREHAPRELATVMALYPQVEQPLETEDRALGREQPLTQKPPETAHDLDVDEAGRVHLLSHHAFGQARAALTPEYQLEGAGGV